MTPTTQPQGTAAEPLSTDFPVFARAVHARFQEMSKRELYVTDVGDTLFDQYLAAFPAGTNPVVRVRPLYDCQTCKSFIRRLGKLVTIESGKVTTVWGGLALPQPFLRVAEQLDAVVRLAPVTGVFRSKERKYGAEYNYDTKTNERHDHFWGDVADRHHAADPAAKAGTEAQTFQVLHRGLTELREADLAAVLELIDANGLYKGAEFKPMITGFLGLRRAFEQAGRDPMFAWEHLADRNARFRNTAVGTLFVDLAKGDDFDKAVRAFEATVAPQNYKRPTAVITQGMVDAALKTLNELDLGGAVHRRYARLSDVSVNDVLFVDNDTRGKMKDGLAAILEGSVKKAAPDLKHAVRITADEFVTTVLPSTKTLEAFVENRHQGNFVSLTGADGPERLFKWGNNFAWSYTGDLADSMKRRVAELGGRVDGPFRFTHSWNHEEWGRNESLMDLHVFFPGHNTPPDGQHDNYGNSRRIGWNNRKDAATGGVQDVDHVHHAKPGEIPIENISFPAVDRMPEGTYTLKVHNWQLRGITKSGFKAEIEVAGQLFQFEHPKPLDRKQWVTVATVQLHKGEFTVTPVLPTTKSSRDVWGVKTETLVPVQLVCYSPNAWSGATIGAKHLILALRGCRNPDAVRTIFNEFLDSRLDPHRKVFEILGSKTKAPYAEEQISGVGFSAARGDTVTVVVDGRRAYTLTF